METTWWDERRAKMEDLSIHDKPAAAAAKQQQNPPAGDNKKKGKKKGNKEDKGATGGDGKKLTRAEIKAQRLAARKQQ